MADAPQWLCFADFEFTCGYPITSDQAELLSIGLVICNADYEIAETFYQTTKPTRNAAMTKRCRKLTHLEQKEIDASRESNGVMQDALRLLKRYNITKMMVWGNFDRPGIEADYRMHLRNKQDAPALKKAAAMIRDVQYQMTRKMGLPEPASIQELSEAFGYLPESGCFHNALNDAMALHAIHKAVHTTDFAHDENFQRLRQNRIERKEKAKQDALKRRIERALAEPVSPELAAYFEQLRSSGDEAALRFLLKLRIQCLKIIRKHPKEEKFVLISYPESPQIFMVIPRSAYHQGKRPFRIYIFTPAQMDSCILQECAARKKAGAAV